MSTALHTPPRINVPDGDSLTRVSSAAPDANGYSAAVLPIKSATKGMALADTLYVQTGGRELMISNGAHTQIDYSIDNCGFRCTPENRFTKWLDRRYNVTGVARNSFWKNCPVEHAVYLAPGPGNLLWSECLFQNIAANAIQLRLATVDNTQTPPEQSAYWLTQRKITLDRVLMLECGQQRGGGRAAFAFSPKSPGPNTEIVLLDCFIQTVKQVDVDGKGHNSFGGCCFEDCKSVLISGTTIELDKPANGALQFYEYSQRPSEQRRAPKESATVVDSIIDNDVDFRIDETPTIKVASCRGKGNIRLWRPNTAMDKWEIVRTIPVVQGYQQGA